MNSHFLAFIVNTTLKKVEKIPAFDDIFNGTTQWTWNHPRQFEDWYPNCVSKPELYSLHTVNLI